MTGKLRERFLGSIAGCAVGDALGAPFEGARPSSIKLTPEGIDFKKIPGYPIGQYTDDTQLTLAIARAICRKRAVDGAEIAGEFVKLWQTGEIVGAGASCTEGVYNIIRRGVSWQEAGTPVGRAGNGTAMRAAPIGLWNYAHPEEIENDARVSSIITHKDPRSVAGTIAVAKAVQTCVDSDEIAPHGFLRDISKSVRNTSDIFAESIEQLMQWQSLEPPEALPLIYAAGNPEMGPRRPGRVTAYVIPTVLCALYCFLRTPRDFPASVIAAISAGGDTDTVAAITGAVSGSLNGISSIPHRLVENLKDSEDIISLAERLYEAAIARG